MGANTEIAESTKLTSLPTYSGRVLLVEDDLTVRSLVVKILKRIGFQADLAGSGEEGLEKLAADYSYRMLVLDISLPGISGLDVLKQVRQAKPSLPVLLVSGYSPEKIAEQLGDDRCVSFLPKPFRLESFWAGVSELLERV